MSQLRSRRLSRRRILSGMAAGGAAVGAGTLFPLKRGWSSARTVHKYADLEAMVVSDGHFVLPTGFLVAPDSPTAEREAALKAAGQTVSPGNPRTTTAVPFQLASSDTSFFSKTVR